jgi:predicted small secreted protein
MKNRSFIFALLAILLLTSILLAACGTTSSSGNTGPLDGKTLMQERCSVCHSTERITSAHKTADQWKVTVERMISHGAHLNATEQQTLIGYLAQTYP